MLKKEWKIPIESAGQKLLSFLLQQFDGQFSAKALKHLIDGHACQINGRVERFSAVLLMPGDQVTLTYALSSPLKIIRFQADQILFEDHHLLIYHKPSGITCDEQGILKVMHTYDKSLILVHRLDKETSGALLFAKSPAIFNTFVTLFKEKKINKQYLAIVDGKLLKKNGTIKNYLGKIQQLNGQSIWGSVQPSHGLTAISEWECLQTSAQASLVACWPKTGRTHQLRVHLSEMGHPILGDYQYGKNFRCSFRPKRLLLHATTLNFSHPVTQQQITVTAPLPTDFIEASNKLFK